MINYNFDSTSFFFNLFVLLLVLLPAYALAPRPWIRRTLFTLTGCYLLYLIAPRLLIFYVLLWTVVAALQRLIFYVAEKRSGARIFTLGLMVILTPMVVWKFTGEAFVIQFNLWTNAAVSLLPVAIWEIDMARDILIPIGLSFATFRAADLLIKTYIGRQELLSLERILFYGFFPPVQIVGPIIEYEEIQSHSERLEPLAAENVLLGTLRIAWGLFKILVLASALQGSTAIFSNFNTQTTATLWFGLVCYTWFFYLNFSAYSDLAIGFSKLFGFNLKENFNNPYFSKNIAQFWNNWHMSLSRFAQRNVFVPMGGFRSKTQFLAIYLTMMTIALWHDITWGMIVFGSYHGAGLILHRLANEKWPREKTATRLVDLTNTCATYLFVAVSFPLLIMPLSRAIDFYAALIGMGVL